MSEREEKIRQRAYQIWQEEGEQHGQAEDHWERAAREIDGQAGASHEQQETERPIVSEPEPVPDIGRASSLHPGGGTTPGDTPGATFGSPRTGSTADRPTGTRKRAKR